MSKKKQHRTDSHIVWDFLVHEIRCLNCGDSFKLNFPVLLDVVIRKSKGFRQMHVDCAEPNKN